MSYLFNRFAPIIGLQINGNSVKCIELVKSWNHISVSGFAYSEIPKNVMNNDTITGRETLQQLITQAIKKPLGGKFTTKQVALSMPETRCFVRVIQLPKMSEAEIDNAVAYEAEAYIPLPVEQVYLDWQIIGEQGDKIELVIFASPKDLVDSYIETLESAGLEVVAIETESKSLARTLVSFVVPETILIVDLDAYRTNLVMVEKGFVQFTSSIPIAGNTFTERIATGLGITIRDAEAIKRKAGVANTPEYPNIQSIVLPLLHNLVAEIQNLIQFHYDRSGERIQKMVLSGGGAKMKNLPEFLTTELSNLSGTKIEVANPWQNIKQMRTSPNLAPHEALDFTVPIGLSMRTLL